ncbi:lipid-A-disaccharide synthase [Geomonas silvestris]|nr:lipid-A-disaccharide synthase [Geomonas silvestris]
MSQRSDSVMIVAGEASGDLYGAELARELRTLAPGTRLIGMGGDRMREAGVETLVDANDMAVMGLVEVVGHLPTIVKGFSVLKKRLLSDPPRLLVLIDYQDFNQRLAKVAKKAGITVLFFISPTVWAWRSGRVHEIRKVVDMMAVLFPFEVPFYEKAHVPVSFVGHPLVDMVPPALNRREARTALGIDPARRTVGLFPGSRKGVLKRLLPTVLESAVLLKKSMPELQFVLPLAATLRPADLEPELSASGLEVAVISGKNHELMSACDAAISVSGTVIMELALVGVPTVLIYKVSPLTYQIGKRVINVPHIGICNIVAGKRIIKELIQHEANPQAIAGEADALLNDASYRAQVVSDLAGVREKLGSGGALKRLALLARQMMEKDAG